MTSTTDLAPISGPLAWRGRPGFTFFQGPPETALIRSGAAALALPSR